MSEELFGRASIVCVIFVDCEDRNIFAKYKNVGILCGEVGKLRESLCMSRDPIGADPCRW